MPGGLRFEATDSGGDGKDHRWTFELSDAHGGVLRSWSVVSDDDLGGTVDEPGWSNGHPVVAVEVARQTSSRFLWEYVAMPLLDIGANARQISLDPHAVWGEPPTTGIRVGPDGALA